MRKYIVLTAASCACLLLSVCLLITFVQLYAVPHNLSSQFTHAQCIFAGITCWSGDSQNVNATFEIYELDNDLILQCLSNDSPVSYSSTNEIVTSNINDINNYSDMYDNLSIATGMNATLDYREPLDKLMTESMVFQDNNSFFEEHLTLASGNICALCDGKYFNVCDKNSCRTGKQTCFVPAITVVDKNPGDVIEHRKLIADPWVFYSLVSPGSALQVNANNCSQF